MDPITQFIDFHNPNLPKKQRDLFRANMKLKHHKKGDILVKKGETPHTFYILTKGLLRSFITDTNGNDHIRTIFTPISTTGSLSSLITNRASNACYDCLTETEILEGDFNVFKKLTNEHHEMSMFYNTVLESIFLRTEKRFYELSVLTSTERYLQLKQEIPNIENLIPQYHIASYLNITAVQLSRIRKKLFSK